MSRFTLLSRAPTIIFFINAITPFITTRASFPDHSASSVWTFAIDQQLHDFRTLLPGNGKITQAHLDEAARAASACGARVAIVNDSIYYRKLFADNSAPPPGVPNDCAARVVGLLSVYQRALSEFDLPNVEFVLNCADMPVAERGTLGPLPVLSYDVNHLDFHDIATPCWSVLSGHYNQINDENQNATLTWKQKKDVAFFRGSTTGGFYTKENWQEMPRTRIVSACRAEGSHCDAMFTGFPQCEAETAQIIENALGKAPMVHEKDYAHYKYNILVDGNGAPASRAVQSVFTNTLLLKVESPFSEFFYPLMQPYVHYLPVSYNATDLLEKVSWARENDERARRMAEELLSFGKRHLSSSAVNEYVHQLLLALAPLFETPPSSPPEGFQLFVPPTHWNFKKQKRVRSHSNGHVVGGSHAERGKRKE